MSTTVRSASGATDPTASDVRSWSPRHSTDAPASSYSFARYRARRAIVSGVAGTWSSRHRDGGRSGGQLGHPRLKFDLVRQRNLAFLRRGRPRRMNAGVKTLGHDRLRRRGGEGHCAADQLARPIQRPRRSPGAATAADPRRSRELHSDRSRSSIVVGDVGHQPREAIRLSGHLEEFQAFDRAVADAGVDGDHGDVVAGDLGVEAVDPPLGGPQGQGGLEHAADAAAAVAAAHDRPVDEGGGDEGDRFGRRGAEDDRGPGAWGCPRDGSTPVWQATRVTPPSPARRSSPARQSS